MSTYTVTSNDTLTLNGRVFTDFAYGDNCSITFPNPLVNMKTGKNGNSIIALNQSGFNADAVLKITRASSDDVFLQSLLSAMNSDFPSTVLMAGTFVKRLGDGQGNVRSDIYTIAGGVISKIPDGKENVEGDTEQGVSNYAIKFAKAVRGIG